VLHELRAESYQRSWPAVRCTAGCVVTDLRRGYAGQGLFEHVAIAALARSCSVFARSISLAICREIRETSSATSATPITANHAAMRTRSPPNSSASRASRKPMSTTSPAVAEGTHAACARAADRRPSGRAATRPGRGQHCGDAEDEEAQARRQRDGNRAAAVEERRPDAYPSATVAPTIAATVASTPA